MQMRFFRHCGYLGWIDHVNYGQKTRNLSPRTFNPVHATTIVGRFDRILEVGRFYRRKTGEALNWNRLRPSQEWILGLVP